MKQSEYKKTPLYLYRNAKESTPDWTSYDLTVDNPDDEHDHTMEAFIVPLMMALLEGTLVTHDLTFRIVEFLYRKRFRNHYGKYWIPYTVDYRRKLQGSDWDNGWLDDIKIKDVKRRSVTHYLREIIPNGDAALLEDVYRSVNSRIQDWQEYGNNKFTSLLSTTGYKVDYSLSDSIENIQSDLISENKAVWLWPDAYFDNCINRFYIQINPALYPETQLVWRIKKVLEQHNCILEIVN